MQLYFLRDNYLSLHFPTQPYLLLFLVFSRESKLFLFQLFRFSMKLIHLHYNWQQNRIGKFDAIFQSISTQLRDAKFGDIFQSVPT